MPKLDPIPGYTHLGIRSKSGTIYLRGSYPGLGEMVRSLHTKDLKHAIKKAKALESEIYKLNPNHKPTTVKEIISPWFDFKVSDWRKSTATRNVMDVVKNRILPNFGHMDLDNVTDVTWKKFSNEFYAKHPEQKLFNTRKWLISIMTYARDQGLVTKKYSYPLRDAKAREGLIVSKADLTTMLKYATPKIRLIITMGYYMGMRISEMLTLDRDRINLKNESLKLLPEHVKTGTQTGKGREIAIAPEVIPLLRQWLDSHDHFLLFPAGQGATGPMRYNSFLHAWNRLCGLKEVNLPDYNPNDLRHTFLDRLLLVEKKNPLDVAIYAGTSLIVIQRTYLHSQLESTRSVVSSDLRTLSDTSDSRGRLRSVK